MTFALLLPPQQNETFGASTLRWFLKLGWRKDKSKYKTSSPLQLEYDGAPSFYKKKKMEYDGGDHKKKANCGPCVVLFRTGIFLQDQGPLFNYTLKKNDFQKE